MKKNDDIKLTITGLSSEGSGIGRDGEMVVFVEGAAVGDELIAHIIKVKKRYAIGTIKELTKPSKDRILIDCPVFKSCGGCSYRHISYTSELEIKRHKIQDALTRLGGIDIEVPPILHSELIDGYRNKAQHPVGMDMHRNVITGFYAKKSHRIISSTKCLLEPSDFEIILKAVQGYIFLSKIRAYDEQTHRGVLRNIYIRHAKATGELMVCLVINGDGIPQKELLVKALKGCACGDKIKSIVINHNKVDTNVVLGKRCTILYGRDHLEDELCGLKFNISPLSFYQVNPLGTEILYGKAKEFAQLKSTDTVLDLYCGAGTIGLTMAKDCKQVIGVEIINEAIKSARENAKNNNIENARFICDDANGAAQTLIEEGIKPNVVVLDPPRKGCEVEVVQAVVKMNPERIVYVSCDPATLARDCAIFVEMGYGVNEVIGVDMFARTVHVESVILMSKIEK